jgi:putative transposase
VKKVVSPEESPPRKGRRRNHHDREILKVQKGFAGKHFWSRGYCVGTVGLDEKMIRAYVRHQDELDQQLEFNIDN